MWTLSRTDDERGERMSEVGLLRLARNIWTASRMVAKVVGIVHA